MHVLLVTKLSLASSLGGAEIIVQTLCEGLVGKGHRVTFLSFDPNGESVRHGNAAVTLVNYAPRIYRLIRHTRFNMAIEALGADPTDRSLQIFKKLVDQETFDVVNTHQLHGINHGIWRAAAERRLPIVHTIHDYHLLCPQGSMYRGGKRCRTQCAFCHIWSKKKKTFARSVGAVGADSKFVLDRHINHGFFTDCYASVIYPAHRGSTPRLKISRPHSPLRLGFIGRLHRVKGLERLFEILRTTVMPLYELRIAGAGNEHYTAFLKECAAGLPVTWMGWLDREVFFPRSTFSWCLPCGTNRPVW